MQIPDSIIVGPKKTALSFEGTVSTGTQCAGQQAVVIHVRNHSGTAVDTIVTRQFYNDNTQQPVDDPPESPGIGIYPLRITVPPSQAISIGCDRWFNNSVIDPIVYTAVYVVDTGVNGVPRYSIEVLDFHLQSQQPGFVYSMNSIETVVGFARYQSTNHAALWSRGNTVDIGSLGGQAFAFAINDNGDVVGRSSLEGNSMDASHGFICRGGRLIDLGTFGTAVSSAVAINNGGTVLLLCGDRPYHSYLWNNGNVVPVASPPTGELFIPQTLNDLGTLAGQINRGGQMRAALLEGSTFIDLGEIGNNTSGPVSLNNAGVAVGHSYRDDPRYGRPTVWKNGAATDLGPLDGFHIGIATTINMSETIAGFSIFPTVGDASTKRGCLWVGGVTYDLNDLVVGSPIIIEAAQHINDAGSILVRGSGSSCAILHPL